MRTKTILLSFLLLSLTFCSTDKKSKTTVSEITNRIKFTKYNIQKILNVPDIKLIRGTKLLSFRTEFHNGTENGVLLVLCKNTKDKIIPIFVLEELFYLFEDEYYIREVSNISDKSLSLELFDFYKGKKKKLLSAKIIFESEKVKVEELKQFGDEDNSDVVLAFFENFDKTKNEIMNSQF